MGRSGPSSSDSTVLGFLQHGFFPLQCGSCGRELIKMGCEQCSPYIPPPTKNRAGFPRYSQLSPKASPCHYSPTSPRKRGSGPAIPRLVRRVEFVDIFEQTVGGETITIMKKLKINGETVSGGNQQPFLRPVRPGQTITILTKFQWPDHSWETREVPCHRGTTEMTLYIALKTHFKIAVERVEKCSNSHACSCSRTVTREQIKILSYQFLIANDTPTLVVKADLDK